MYIYSHGHDAGLLTTEHLDALLTMLAIYSVEHPGRTTLSYETLADTLHAAMFPGFFTAPEEQITVHEYFLTEILADHNRAELLIALALLAQRGDLVLTPRGVLLR